MRRIGVESLAEGTIVLIDLPFPSDEDPLNALAKRKNLFDLACKRLSVDGSFWVTTSNGVQNGQMIPWPMVVAEHLRASYRYLLKNILIHYVIRPSGVDRLLIQAYDSILFLVKSQEYFFDKRLIREAHIFKGIEWGRRKSGKSSYHPDRASSRYPEGGRDPGNVFYLTKRDENGLILDVSEYSKQAIFEKLILASTKKEWTILTNIDDPELDGTIARLERRLVLMGET